MQGHLNKARAPKRVLNHAQAALGREGVAGNRVKTGVKSHVVVGRIEAGVIENVEEVRGVFQIETFAELGLFDDGEIKAGLKRSAEDVAPSIAESVLPLFGVTVFCSRFVPLL